MANPSEPNPTQKATQQKTPLFSVPMPASLEARILEQLEPRELAKCRLVNSRWRDAVDSLDSLWCSLSRRIGIADHECCRQREGGGVQQSTDEGGCHELPKIRKLLTGDCWMSCDLCPTVNSDEHGENLPPLSDLQLLDVNVICERIDQPHIEGSRIKVCAFDRATAKGHSWMLYLPGADEDCWNIFDYKIFSKGAICEWTALVKVQIKTWMRKYPRDSHLDIVGELLCEQLLAKREAKKAKRDNHGERNKSNSDFFYMPTFNPTTNELQILKLFETSALLRELNKKEDFSRGVLAVVPLAPTPSGTVIPQAFITVSWSGVGLAIATHRCKAGSLTQLILLTSKEVKLYVLPDAKQWHDPNSEELPPFLPVVATIDLHTEPPVLENRRVTPYFDMLTPLRSSRWPFAAECDSESFVLVFSENNLHGLNFTKGLAILELGFETINIIKSINLPQQLGIRFSRLKHCDAFLIARLDEFSQPRGKLMLVRTSRNSAQLYNKTVSLPKSANTLVFDCGTKFWYLIGETPKFESALVIYRIGCANPLVQVNLFGLLPTTDHSPFYMYVAHSIQKSVVTCTWIDDGLGVNESSVPILIMQFGKDIQLMFSLFCEKPPSMASGRMKRFRIAAAGCLNDWPWRKWQRNDPKTVSKLETMNGGQVANLVFAMLRDAVSALEHVQ